jgi:hypothetical protein
MPKAITTRSHLESLARSYTGAAIKTLTEIMMNPSAPARARREAAATLARFDTVMQLNQKLGIPNEPSE